MEFNFRKYNWNYIQNLSAPYDLSSVMHYGSYAFSKDRRMPTILPKDPNRSIGQRNGFSEVRWNDISSTDTFRIENVWYINCYVYM